MKNTKYSIYKKYSYNPVLFYIFYIYRNILSFLNCAKTLYIGNCMNCCTILYI